MAQHPVALSCRVRGVARSGYYAWRRRVPSARAQADARLKERIRAIHQTSRGTYGSPRIHAELRRAGERCGRRRVARLMREGGLRGVHGQRRRMRTTLRDRQATPAPDRVPRGFSPPTIGAPDRRWVADISDVATLDGWLSLAVVLDAFSRRVVGWAMADHLRTELVLDALGMALRHRQPRAGLIHHSDHGGQYTSLAFGQRLQEAGLLPSMGTVGDCNAFAVAERGCPLGRATLKVELLHRQVWPTRATARLAIFAFIEVWSNRRRRHSTLGYATPTEYEALAREMVIAEHQPAHETGSSSGLPTRRRGQSAKPIGPRRSVSLPFHLVAQLTQEQGVGAIAAFENGRDQVREGPNQTHVEVRIQLLKQQAQVTRALRTDLHPQLLQPRLGQCLLARSLVSATLLHGKQPSLASLLCFP